MLAELSVNQIFCVLLTLETMAAERIPMVSVRNPWGFLIQRGFKKIENRSKNVNQAFIDRWLALHVSKTFKSTESNYAYR